LNKVRLFLAVLTVLSGGLYSHSSSYKSSTAAGNKQIVFSVRISDLGLQNNSLARGKQPTEWIEVRLPGQLYDPAKRFGPVTRKAANWTTPIDAAIADFSAFKADDTNWILDDFVTQEKKTAGLLGKPGSRGWRVGERPWPVAVPDVTDKLR
jgi:hypothetical protein